MPQQAFQVPSRKCVCVCVCVCVCLCVCANKIRSLNILLTDMLTSTNEVTTAIAMKQDPGGIEQEKYFKILSQEYINY